MGKTVNSFRKHEVAGEVAKSLVAKWKKLVPQSADRYVLHTCPKTCKTVVRSGAVHALALVSLYSVSLIYGGDVQPGYVVLSLLNTWKKI